MPEINSRTILFITGAFVAHSCWDKWKIFFESNGYTTIAPPWPFKNGSAAELRARKQYETNLASLTLSGLIDYYIDIVDELPEKPIVIGHSLGGLITQILCNRDLAAAAIAIHSTPPSGIFPYEFSFLRSGWKSLGLFTSLQKTYLMSFKDWQYAFVNGMTDEEQMDTYENFVIPESKRVIRGGMTRAAKVDYAKSHAPLLIMAGTDDNFIPAHLNHRNYKKYKRSNQSILHYKECKGRNHFVLGQSTWKEDAEYILRWIKNPEYTLS